MLKEIETEETIGFFVIFLSLAAFQLEGGPVSCPPPPLALPMLADVLFTPLQLEYQPLEAHDIN